MDRVTLKADEREIVGKKVKKLRAQGIIPGHVYGYKTEPENVSVDAKDFKLVYAQAGSTGLVNLKLGEERVRPVLIRDVIVHPVTDTILNIDFYQVNLKEKATVYTPITMIGEGPESVKLGETVVLQTLSEIEIEALPTDFIEGFEVDISVLKEVDDTITVADLQYDKEKITVLAEPEEVIVKLAPAVTQEMQELLEEQEAEAAAAQEATEGEETEGETPEGEEGGEPSEEGEETPAADDEENS